MSAGFYTGFIAGGGHQRECQIIAKYTTLKDVHPMFPNPESECDTVV